MRTPPYSPNNMDTARFDYHLPPQLIAQFPAAERTASRLLHVRRDGAHEEMRFGGIGALLRRGDLLVANDTRVLPARLFARKPSGGAVEILLERIIGEHAALVQLRANKPLRVKQVLHAAGAEWVVGGRRGAFYVIECDGDAESLFRRHGEVPLPPYIARAAVAQDCARYQTVYARADGAVAAPTAGLHFDRALIDALRRAGIGWAAVTLHVGAGTFRPVRAASAGAHRMHREWAEVRAGACARIARAKLRGGRVVAIGTSVVRALESAIGADGRCAPFCGDTELFIRPGHRFRAVDALLTNFHLPRSTLLMLVCAFAGYDVVMRAYQHAIAREFRFYSYGDAMFVELARASA
ncbi:MAG: tRNA preQ1(34) S-adenosylmethionine ribosyltransferase-isomerase QueA [Gammaproteobacteria bacterium]